jgi:intracellular septation protein A
MPAPATTTAKKPNPFVELFVTIIVPALILMKLSAQLGHVGALLLALAFPLSWGVWGFARERKVGLMPAIGVISTLLTGGIGLMKLDAQWLAVKEAAVPGLIGLAVLGSMYTRSPLVRLLVYNPQIFDVERIQQALREKRAEVQFELLLRRGTLLLAGTFFFSSVMNYVLARWIVTSAAGSEAFNEELGRLTLLSYPMIALPSMAMMIAVLFDLARGARRLTGLKLEEMMHHAAHPPKP